MKLSSRSLFSSTSGWDRQGNGPPIRIGQLEHLVGHPACLRCLEVSKPDLDLAVTFAQDPLLQPYDRWSERVVWVRGPPTVYDSTGPVPLVAQGEDCVLTKLSVEALDLAGRDWELVFTGQSSASVAG